MPPADGQAISNALRANRVVDLNVAASESGSVCGKSKTEAGCCYFVSGFFRAPCSAVLGAQAHAADSQNIPVAKPLSRGSPSGAASAGLPLDGGESEGIVRFFEQVREMAMTVWDSNQ